MDLKDIRNKIDSIDDELLELFKKRMDIVSEVAAYKRQHGLPILNSQRERDIVARVTEGMDDSMASYTKTWFNTMFECSRSYQSMQNKPKTDTEAKIEAALLPAETLFPKSAVVACQGVEGANSQLACDRLF
ncbi:MAG: chorismate mutase, partial [Clostridia bacterium]|nr:chorismate mutase [Clostridia bacterium]